MFIKYTNVCVLLCMLLASWVCDCDCASFLARQILSRTHCSQQVHKYQQAWMRRRTDAAAKFYKQTHTRTLACTRTHAHTLELQCRRECEAWLSLAPPLSFLGLAGNKIAMIPSELFSGLSSLRSFLLSLTQTCTCLFIQFSCFVYFIIFPFL